MNFISKNVSEKDKKLFFGDETDFIIIEDNWILAHIMAKIGVFKSVNEARKNGWNKPIPNGFSEFKVGKLKTHVAILKILDKI